MNFKTKDINLIEFIKAAGITGGSEFNAINYLVLALKNNNLWNKLNAVYPFIGGTAVTHSYNLKNPAQFRILWNGTVTHNENGITPNGSNGYGNTQYIPGSNVITNSESMGLYSRTLAGSGVAGIAIDMGVVGTGGRSLMSIKAATGGDLGLNQMNDSVGSNFNDNFPVATGLHILSRTTSTLLEHTRNGVVTSSSTGANALVAPTLWTLYIGCRNNAGTAIGFVLRNFAFAFMGDGLTSAETLVLFDIVQQYNFMLNRHV